MGKIMKEGRKCAKRLYEEKMVPKRKDLGEGKI